MQADILSAYLALDDFIRTSSPHRRVFFTPLHVMPLAEGNVFFLYQIWGFQQMTGNRPALDLVPGLPRWQELRHEFL